MFGPLLTPVLPLRGFWVPAFDQYKTQYFSAITAQQTRVFLVQLQDHEGFTREHECTRLPEKSASSCVYKKMVFLFPTFCHVQRRRIGQDFILKYGRTRVLPLWGKSSQIRQTRKLSFQIQHLEGVLSSKEEALRHAQESHEQTVNKVKRKWAAVPQERKNMKLRNMATFKSYNPDKINQGTRVIFLLLPETNYVTLQNGLLIAFVFPW